MTLVMRTSHQLISDKTGLPNRSLFMMSSNENSALLALCTGNAQLTGEFPSQSPVTQSFDIFFHLQQTVQQTIETLVI